ncbi:MAG TPA: TolC family protein [Bryobacteraceae bacterium]|nr:TolC family protein [Bryobacteraceae bacterium]
MNSSRLFLIPLLAGAMTFAQTPEISITAPPEPAIVGPLLRPFHWERRIVSPARLTNSPRLEALIRGGNLYLSARDVIALVLENNVDIAIQRYGPFMAREVLRRAEGGGFLRSVGTPILPGPVSVSLAGVSVSTVGLAEGGGVGSGGGIVIQLGTPPPNLDPLFFAYANFGHQTTPLSNAVLSQTTALTNDFRTYQFGYSQSFVTGTNYQITYTSTRTFLNSPTVIENPALNGNLDFYITENLLQGFSRSVNNRNIRVARNNMKVTDLQLKRQVITTVGAALNLYWDLVSFDDDMRTKQQALETAEKLYEDNKQQVQLGTLPAIEVTRAAAQVSASREDLLISQTNVAQQETILKNALSRNGVAAASLDEVHIIPLDKIVVPEKEDLKATPLLIQQAMERRPELEQTRINLQSSLINLGGTRNALLPTLQAFADFSNNALSGPLSPIYNGSSGPPDAYLIGGYGNLLAQIFRRNFPNYSAGFSLNIPFRNRQAQADYVTDQLNLRQSELQLQRAINQVRVDVKNAVIGLEQARSRYEAAVATRQLAQQTLEAEQNRFKFGESTISLVIQAQREVTSDQSAEIQAMANYTHAKIAFDEAVGQTLEANGISMEEARAGRVGRQSVVPSNAPAAPNAGDQTR